jgi:hypothetical protein
MLKPGLFSINGRHFMRHIFLFCGLLAVFAVSCPADETTTARETLIRLSAPPARAPKPALRYRLLPEIREMNPGNPIQNYFKCFMEQHKFFFDKEAFERREKLLTMPLKELPAQELAEYGRFALRQADWAARLDNPDWEILLKLKTDGVGLLLPDVQQMRALVNAIQVRFRSEISLRRFDDAIRTAKTMFAIARHLSEHPTLIGNLVGIATANQAIGTLEEMLEQPGCPNLYWALTNLPIPLVPLDKGMGGERALVLSEFRDLDDRASMSAQQLGKFIAHMELLVAAGQPSTGPGPVRAWLDARAKDENVASAARRRLNEVGIPEERTRHFPADQVILLDEKREYDVRIDDVMKLVHIPMWQTETQASQNRLPKSPALFADALVPGVDAVRATQARLDQRIALLRHVEALRLYAADHNGALPANLSECSVPLPDDPFSGKPFRYERHGTTAHVSGSPPVAEQNNAKFNVHYELTLQK